MIVLARIPRPLNSSVVSIVHRCRVPQTQRSWGAAWIRPLDRGVHDFREGDSSTIRRIYVSRLEGIPVATWPAVSHFPHVPVPRYVLAFRAGCSECPCPWEFCPGTSWSETLSRCFQANCVTRTRRDSRIRVECHCGFVPGPHWHGVVDIGTVLGSR